MMMKSEMKIVVTLQHYTYATQPGRAFQIGCELWTAAGLRTADCGPRTADYGPRTADCGLRTADWVCIKYGPGIKCELRAMFLN